MNRETAGLLAGMAATVPMTATMQALHAVLPGQQGAEAVPERITSSALRQVGALTGTAAEQVAGPKVGGAARWSAAGLFNHFSYGSGVGSMYALTRRHLPRSPALSGALFGLFVYGASYLGWLPVAGLHPSALDESREKNALLIGAHLVYGVSLGYLYDALADAAQS